MRAITGCNRPVVLQCVCSSLPSVSPPHTKAVYRPRGINAIQLLFKRCFQSIAEQYESKYAVIYGRFRIERITEVVEKFVLCGLGAPVESTLARHRAGKPNASRILNRCGPARKNRHVRSLPRKVAPPGPGSSLRCTRAARPGAPLTCSRCGSPMRILAVITEPEEVRRILRHLVKIGPGGAPLRRAADPLRGWIRASCNCQSVPFLCAPGITLSPWLSLLFLKAVFLARGALLSSREVRLSRHWL